MKFILLLLLFIYQQLGEKIRNSFTDWILYVAGGAEQFPLENFIFILLLNHKYKISFAYRAA